MSKKIILRYLVLLMFLIQTNEIYSQDTTHKFSYSFAVTPQISYHKLFLEKQNDPFMDSVFQQIYNYRMDTELPIFNLTGGVNLLWNINDIYTLETGIQYGEFGYKTKWVEFPNTSDPSMPDSVKLNYHFRYAEIPIRFYYCLNKQLFYGGIGLTPGFLLWSTSTIYQHFEGGSVESDRTLEDISGFNKFSLSASLNFGFRFILTDKYSLRIQPNVNYQLFKVISSPVTAKFRSIGTSLILQMNR